MSESLIQTMESKDTKPKTRRMDRPVEIKYVTIAGKEVEVKYELCQRKVDIFGLHKRDRDRRSGPDFANKKPLKNQTSRMRSANDLPSNGNKRDLIINGTNHSIDSSNTSNQSIDSRESTSESIRMGSKADRLLKKFELEDEVGLKKSDTIDRLVNKMKKEKEPIKMENKFDKLMSSVAIDDLDGQPQPVSSSKSRKKKNKTNACVVSVIDNLSDNNSDKCESKNVKTVPNRANPSTESKPLDRKSEEAIDSNHKLNNSYLKNINSSDDKSKLLDKEALKDWRSQSSLKVFKNSIRDTVAGDAVDASGDKADQSPVTSAVEESSIATEVDDLEKVIRARVQKIQKKVLKKADKHVNGVSAIKDKMNSEKPVAASEETIVQKRSDSSMIKWFFISTSIVIFLVLYAVIVLNLFCQC